MSSQRWMASLNGFSLLVLVPVLGWAVYGRAQTEQAASVSEAMRQGAAQMKAGNFAEAAAAYALVTKAAPAFAEGYFDLGLAEEQAGQLDAARASLEKAVRLKPGLRGANLFLGTIAYRQNRFKEAETRLVEETRLDQNSAKAFMWLGVCRLAEDDPHAAIAPLEKAYALDPSDVDILYHRGRAYLLMANASYDAMFKQDHDSVRVHQVLGEAYAQGYRNQDAIGEFELAIRMAPRQPGLHEELGDENWVAGHLDRAAQAYREELHVDPNAATAMYKLGSLLVQQDQGAQEGIELLRVALRLDPSLTDAHYYLGVGLMVTSKDEDAIGEFQAAIVADPKGDRAMTSYYKLSQVYRKLHKADEAQAALENFQRMRAEGKQRQDSKAAQLVRKRSELPVDDQDASAIKGDQQTN